MSKGWQEWLRQKLIERLKPGRTEEELIDLVNSAEAIKSDEQRRHMEQMVEFYDTSRTRVS